MVGIVKCVEEIFVERVDILEARKSVEDKGELFAEGLLCEFDLPSIEVADS